MLLQSLKYVVQNVWHPVSVYIVADECQDLTCPAGQGFNVHKGKLEDRSSLY